MDERVRMVTELEIRRLAAGLDPLRLTIALGFASAESAGLKPRTVVRWEAGEHLPYATHSEALSKHYNVASIAWLGLGLGPVAARWRTYMTPEEMTEEVNRRQMHALTANAAAALLLPVSDLVAIAQLLSRRPHVNAGDVATARRTATDIATAYAAEPNAHVIRAAKAHAYTLLDLLGRATMDPATRTALEAVASDAASLAGVGESNAGRLDRADGWFTDAVELARQAGDRRLEALALVGRAWNWLERPDPDQATVVETLEAAAAFHPFLPPAARAYVFGSLARERATLGDDLVSGRFLELSRAAAALAPHADPGWGWWSVHGELAGWEHDPRPLYTGLRSLRLGRPAEALELFDGALAGEARPLRRCGLFASIMQACVGLDDPDRACASGIAALDEAKPHGLAAGWERKARATFPPRWNMLAPVVELDERLALAG